MHNSAIRYSGRGDPQSRKHLTTLDSRKETVSQLPLFSFYPASTGYIPCIEYGAGSSSRFACTE
jgi:hypothetical protein